MYEFRDLKKHAGSDDALPSEALNWNGEYLDEKITGFTTLNVEGRENFSRAINAPEMVGDGSLYLNSRFQAKTIIVSFQLLANSGTELQDRFDRLKNWLYQPQKQFYFADEPNYYYIGTVSKVENSKPGQLNILGTIEITCSDPYKHSEIIITHEKINDPDLIRPTRPISLKFVADEDGADFKLTTSDGMKITVNRGFASGDSIFVNFKNLTVSYNSTMVLIDLALESNLGDFTIQNGTEMTVNHKGTLTIAYEVIQL